MRNALAQVAVRPQRECNVSEGNGHTKIRQTNVGAVLKRNSVGK